MSQKPQGTPLYSILESYTIYYQAIRTMPHMMRGEKQGLLSMELRERLMMAVTEVNGCAMCSWYHTKMALEGGMDEGEVRELLSGELGSVPGSEIAAVLFAQHYADRRGKPDKAAWNTLVTKYGKAKSLAMLGAIRGIMLGNVLGIPSGSFASRMGSKRFHKDDRSSVFYELTLLLSSAILMPLAALHAVFSRLLQVSVEP